MDFDPNIARAVSANAPRRKPERVSHFIRRVHEAMVSVNSSTFRRLPGETKGSAAARYARERGVSKSAAGRVFGISQQAVSEAHRAARLFSVSTHAVIAAWELLYPDSRRIRVG